MSIQLTISQDYGYVILAATSTFVMNIIHGGYSGTLRKACKDMGYPLPYATAEQNAKSPTHLAFSCAQRAHGNFIENQPTALTAMLLSGLVYPRTAAALGLFWSVNRYIYLLGYIDPKTGPKGRSRGFGFFLAQFGLIGLTMFTGAKVAGLV